jgi:hypothetical protein
VVRPALTLLTAALLSAWASAQSDGPARTTTADNLRLLASNRALLEDLIAHGLKLSEASKPLDRAAECEKAAGTLSKAIVTACAAPAPDADRVSELTDYLTAVVSDGLRPVLREAERDIPPGSPGYDEFLALRGRAADATTAAADAIPAQGKFGDLPQVRAARAKLAAAGK